MPTLKQEYRIFLNDNFSGLKLRKPLFYSWSCGLRFDLQEGQTNTDEYFIEVTRRASTIFETAFDSSDRLIFVFKDYKWGHRKIRPTNYVFGQIDKLDKNEICYSKEVSVYEHNDIYNIALIRLITSRINYKNILTAIAYNDFPSRQPRLEHNGMLTSKEIYFVNIDKKLIFHMYDDRGLDIIAENKEILRPIYQKHNAWILDYDRERIDKQFE